MNRKKTAIITFLAGILIAFFALDLGGYLSLEVLKANRENLSSLYAEHKVTFIVVFLALYVLQTALSVPGATILSLAAGAIFGVAMGTILAVTGATIGAGLAFLLTRYLFRDAVQRKFGPRLGKLNQELEQQGLNYLLFLRLMPLFPFFLINLAAGLTTMPLRTFLLGTFVGIVPGGFIYVNAGASLATIDSAQEILSPKVLGAFVLLALFALAPIIYTKIKNRGTASL